MPRGFDVSTESSATVAEVHSAFGNADYWRDRLAVFGGDSIRLDSLVVEGGSVVVGTTQDLRNDVLPGLIAKAVPGDLKVLPYVKFMFTGCTFRSPPSSFDPNLIEMPSSG